MGAVTTAAEAMARQAATAALLGATDESFLTGAVNEAGEDWVGAVHRDMVVGAKPSFAWHAEDGLFAFEESVSDAQAPEADEDSTGSTEPTSRSVIDMPALRERYSTWSAGGRPGWGLTSEEKARMAHPAGRGS